MNPNQMQPTRTIIVDGQRYLVQFYNPTFGFTLWARLLRLMHEPFITMLEGFAKGKTAVKDSKPILDSLLDANFEDVNLNTIGEAMVKLFAGIKDTEVAPLLLDILSQTFYADTRQNVIDTFETAFAGKYLTVLRLAGRTLTEQYADFWSGIVKQSRGAMPASDSAKASVAALQTGLNAAQT